MTTDPMDDDPDEPRRHIGVITMPGASGAPSDPGDPGAPSGSGSHGAHDRRASANSGLSAGHRRLLEALESAFPVRFEHLDTADPRGLDGVLALGSGAASMSVACPMLVLPSRGQAQDRDARRQAPSSDLAADEADRVRLARATELPVALRGRAIPEGASAGSLPPAPSGAVVLAEAHDRPVWWCVRGTTASTSASAYPLPELDAGEALRGHLRVGRFMGLLPLVRFLDEVLGEERWRPPRPRAAFVIDDPNLHWPSYGFIRFRELAEHAARHGYHVALATVPIDGWMADRRAAALLVDNASQLSLVMHGNDHVARELERLDTDERARAAIAQALRRVTALERRCGVAVDRVMTPPHGACSEAALRAMFRLGVEAISVAPTYPWRIGMPAATPLAVWEPTDLVGGGLPVLPRYQLHAPREELALRALLGQPLILYGHHDDLADGLDVLARAAAEIDGLGEVGWGPLSWIARGSYATRLCGDSLSVRMHARRIAVEVPAGVRTLRVFVREPLGGAGGQRLIHANDCMRLTFRNGWGISGPLSVTAPRRIDLALLADRPLSPDAVPPPRASLWPWIRRVLAESQDRIQALR